MAAACPRLVRGGRPARAILASRAEDRGRLSLPGEALIELEGGGGLKQRIGEWIVASAGGLLQRRDVGGRLPMWCVDQRQNRTTAFKRIGKRQRRTAYGRLVPLTRLDRAAAECRIADIQAGRAGMGRGAAGPRRRPGNHAPGPSPFVVAIDTGRMSISARDGSLRDVLAVVGQIAPARGRRSSSARYSMPRTLAPSSRPSPGSRRSGGGRR